MVRLQEEKLQVHGARNLVGYGGVPSEAASMDTVSSFTITVKLWTLPGKHAGFLVP